MARLVTVFGGTGFLGRQIVERLTREGDTVRIAVRHPEGAKARPQSDPVAADIRDDTTVASAVAGAAAVVNAVSLYMERAGLTYRSVHVQGALNVAHCCARLGITQLVHISGIGADPRSSSPYIRARGEGEQVVREAFSSATILRPSVMFGPDDAFLRTLMAIGKSTPVVPLIGGGVTRMQPIHVADVAEAVRLCLTDPQRRGQAYELGGPEIYSLRELIEMILAQMGRRRTFLAIPFGIARPLARVLEYLPRAPLTTAQVDLLMQDSVPARGASGAKELGMALHRLRDTVAALVSKTEGCDPQLPSPEVS
ncbi:MAG: complex I NDUFA9 subunit family protein [Acetobacteraceae bacterium]|nr:complex I NDUFA9 subunit family protein [Acetobacteraceae bacterium]